MSTTHPKSDEKPRRRSREKAVAPTGNICMQIKVETNTKKSKYKLCFQKAFYSYYQNLSRIQSNMIFKNTDIKKRCAL